jgi:uncharacterized protein
MSTPNELAVSATSYSAPLRKKDRILFLDSLRGIALLGILLMNSMAQSQPHQYYASMNLSQSITGANFYAWFAECFFFEGTMRGMFSILFGAGTLLLLDRLTKTKKGLEPADIYYRRLLWLLVFGLINAFVFLWPGDILYPYAICGLLLSPFRNWSAKNCIWAAVFFLAIGTYRENSDLYHQKAIITNGIAAEKVETSKAKLTPQQQEDLEKYKGFKEESSAEGIAKDAKVTAAKVEGKNYAAIFTHFVGVNMMLESTVFYKSYWFDILMCFFLGMAFYKSGYLTGKRSNYLYAIMAVGGIGAGLLLNYFLLREQYHLRFDNFLLAQKWKFSYYQLRRVVQTVGYLSLLVLMYKAIPFRKVLNIFVPVGQMAFTNYLMQSIITSTIFYGMGWYNKLQRYEVYYVVAGIWIFQIALSHIWLAYFRFGPFEWLWRSLTYLKKQPMLRKVEEPTDEEEQQPMPGLVTA